MEPIKTVGVLTLHLPETIEAAGGGKAFKDLVKQVRQAWRNHKGDSLQLRNHLKELGVSLPEGKSFGWIRMKWTQLQRFFSRKKLQSTAERQKLHTRLYESESLDALKAALDAGADPNYRPVGGNTLLHVYSAKDSKISLDERAKMIELLLERGGKLSIANNADKTPLNIASENASLAKVLAKRMLEKGQPEDVKAALMRQNAHGDTPLHNLASELRPNKELMEAMNWMAPEARKLKNVTGKTPYGLLDLMPSDEKEAFSFLVP